MKASARSSSMQCVELLVQVVCLCAGAVEERDSFRVFAFLHEVFDHALGVVRDECGG